MKKKMFNDKYGMTYAVLDGRKTMWRSVFDYEKYKKMWDDMCRLGTPCFDTFNDFLFERASYYKIGEVVAVAQAYKYIEEYNPDSYEDVMLDQGTICESSHPYSHLMKSGGWDNKMFVKADLMPHQIKITDIKVERLQDISYKDCIKEGIYVSDTFTKYGIRNGYSPQCSKDPKEKRWWFDSPREAFAALIDKVSVKGTWKSNPYVFAYTFKLVK